MFQRENINAMDKGIGNEVSNMEMTLKNRKILSERKEIDVLSWAKKK